MSKTWTCAACATLCNSCPHPEPWSVQGNMVIMHEVAAQTMVIECPDHLTALKVAREHNNHAGLVQALVVARDVLRRSNAPEPEGSVARTLATQILGKEGI